MARLTPSRRAATQERMDLAVGIVDSLRAFWPVTLRQVYYRHVAIAATANVRSEYQRLSRLLTDARIEGLVPWEAMEDRARTGLYNGGWSSAQEFIDRSKDSLLTGYRRHLLQTQAIVPEVWIEKDALARICQMAVSDLCVDVHVARGFSSISQIHNLRLRVEENAARGQGTAILFFSDLDPSGCEMLPAMMRTLRGRFNVGDELVARRCALSLEQVHQYELPRNPDALKLSDSRAAAYFEKYGDLAVELDAIAPDLFLQLVRSQTLDVLDQDEFRRQIELEDQDKLRLVALRADAIDLLGEANA